MSNRPRIFVGSSVEGLEIAYSIQVNLEYNADVTVWDQGVFNLSKTTLDDLLEELDNSQFGIFILTPDDVSKIRNEDFKVTRDNVLFELGLFMGKLGKDKVFSVRPANVQDFHLPTDLLGINIGTFFEDRSDKNLTAALGPFCHKVRKAIKKYNDTQGKNEILGFENASEKIIKILENKPEFWEFRLVEQLLREGLQPINQSYYNIKNGLLYEKKKHVSASELFKLLNLKLGDIVNISELIQKVVSHELMTALGEPGQAGDPTMIKNCIDRLINYCEKLLEIELQFNSLKANDLLQDLVNLHKGLTTTIIDALNDFPEQLKTKCNSEYLKNHNNVLNIQLEILLNDNLSKISELQKVIGRNIRKYSDEFTI